VIDAISVITPGVARRVKYIREADPALKEEWKQRFSLAEGRDTFNYGRISRIPDKEGKTRVITVLNYWTQNALKPIHDSCEGILHRLPWDCTFDQGSFKSILSLDTKSQYHSIDLKDATDRFPRFLQKAVVEVL